MIDVTTYAPPSDSMNVFCEAVKSHLRTQHISQNELARRAGMTKSDVSMRLNGRKGNCDLSTCDDFAKALGYANAFEMVRAAGL